MKKAILKAFALTTLLAFTAPICANAAELKVDKTELTLGELIEVTVKTEKPVELMQFDLKFDNQKYKYEEEVISQLDATAAKLMKDDKDGGIVRVSAYDLNGDKTDTLTLKFRAINMGENIPSFSIDTDAVLELGEEGEDFGDNEITVTIDKIGPAIVDYPDDNPNNNPNSNPDGTLGSQSGEDGKYLNDDGEEITQLPKTGDMNKKAVGTFSRLGPLTNVIPYALADSDDFVSFKNDVQVQFTTATNSSIGEEDIVKTGDTVDIPDGQGTNINHTFILYGDVNQDGRITTSDALAIHKGKTKDGTELNATQKEAADIKNDGIVNDDDANAVQSFVLKTRQTATGTIITTYPVKTIEKADIGEIADDTVKYSYTNVTVATLTAHRGAKLTEELLKSATTVTPPKGVTNVTNDNLSYHINEDGTEAEIKLYVTGVGGYLVSVVIEGDEGTVENGKISVNDYDVEVKENKAITRIEMTENKIEVGPNKEKVVSMKLYHSDYDRDGNVIAGSEKLIEDPAVAANMKLQKANNTKLKEISIVNSDNKEITFDQNGTITSGQGYPVAYLRIKAQGLTEEMTETLTIVADNSAYYSDSKKQCKIELTITIDPAQGNIGLSINGTKVTDGSTIPITIYEQEPTRKPSNVETSNDDGLVYTLLPISYENGEAISMGDVTSDFGETYKDEIGKIAIIEKANPNSSNEMSVMGYVEKDDGSEPFVKNNTIDKIAIAFSGRGNIEDLKSGIEIWYDKVEGKKVVRRHITLNVTVVLAGEEAPQADDIEIPEDEQEPTPEITNYSLRTEVESDEIVSDEETTKQEVLEEEEPTEEDTPGTSDETLKEEETNKEPTKLPDVKPNPDNTSSDEIKQEQQPLEIETSGEE